MSICKFVIWKDRGDSRTKKAEGEEDEEVFKWGLQLKKDLKNYKQIIENLYGLLKEKELDDRN